MMTAGVFLGSVIRGLLFFYRLRTLIITRRNRFHPQIHWTQPPSQPQPAEPIKTDFVRFIRSNPLRANICLPLEALPGATGSNPFLPLMGGAAHYALPIAFKLNYLEIPDSCAFLFSRSSLPVCFFKT
jgi:hypothetical protein